MAVKNQQATRIILLHTSEALFCLIILIHIQIFDANAITHAMTLSIMAAGLIAAAAALIQGSHIPMVQAEGVNRRGRGRLTARITRPVLTERPGIATICQRSLM